MKITRQKQRFTRTYFRIKKEKKEKKKTKKERRNLHLKDKSINR